MICSPIVLGCRFDSYQGHTLEHWNFLLANLPTLITTNIVMFPLLLYSVHLFVPYQLCILSLVSTVLSQPLSITSIYLLKK